jgi:hypothetical protein
LARLTLKKLSMKGVSSVGRLGVASVVVVSLLLSAGSAFAEEAPEGSDPAAAPAAGVAGASDEGPADGPSAIVSPAPSPTVAPSSGASIALVAPQSPPVGNADAPVVASDPRDRLRVGALVGVGFPRPLAVEGFVKVNRRLAVGAEYSFLPRANLFGADTSFKAVAVDLRLFPFKNGFFVGVRGGRQWLDAKATASLAGAGESASEAMRASTWFVNPRLGFLHTFESGITVGLDAGVQIPVGAEYTRTATGRAAGTQNDASETLRTAANVLGNKTTPTVDLLRVGFVF